MFDIAGSLIVWLRDQPEISVLPATVAAYRPREIPDRLVIVQVLGGTSIPPVIDQPTVNIEAWGKTQDIAHDLAQTVRGLIWGLQGSRLNGTAIYRIQEFSRPAWRPDIDTGRPRYVATYSVMHRENLLEATP